MLGWLRAIVDWIFGRPSSLIQLPLQATYGAPRNRWEGPDPPKRPYDPDSPVRSPRRYGPTGRSASVAVAEPVDDESLVAVGGPHSGTGRLVRHQIQRRTLKGDRPVEARAAYAHFVRQTSGRKCLRLLFPAA